MKTLPFIRSNGPWLAAGFLLTFCSSFGQTFFISIFAGEIMSAFSLSHGEWGALYMTGTLAAAATMVWAGVLTDHIRVRALGAPVLAILALTCFLMSQITAAWMLPIAIFLLRICGQGMAGHIAAVAMARWFVAARGRALAIASFGYAVGEAVLPIVFVSLMVWIGWRGSWILSGLMVLALTPLIWVFLRQERTPQSIASENQSVGMKGRHWSRKEVLRLPLFWLILPTLLGPPAFGTAFFFLQVHIAEINGWSHLQIVGLFPIYTATAVALMIISGFAIDRFGTARLMPFYAVFSAFGYLVFVSTNGLLAGAVGIALIGLTSGLQATVPIAFWAEFFGTRHLGAIKSLATAIMVFGTAVGPGLTGYLIDIGINFEQQMIGIAAYLFGATVLAFIGVSAAKGELPPPAKIDKIRT